MLLYFFFLIISRPTIAKRTDTLFPYTTLVRAVDSAFVPDRRSAPFLPALAGQSAGHALHATPMYHIPFLPFAMNEVLPVIVGTHRGAADALYARSEEHTSELQSLMRIS